MSVLDEARFSTLLYLQNGVISRPQVLEAGGTDNDIERMLRRRDLVTVHRGVYIDHTGGLTRLQRAWAAVLAVWPAALAGDSALPGALGRSRGEDLEIAVDETRRVAAPPGTRVRRVVDLAHKVQWAAAPPQMLIEHAALDAASHRLRKDDVAGAYAVLARACGSRVTNPARISKTLHERTRVTRRDLIAGMLDDLAAGADSVLERGYLLGVERQHGLPRGTRQRRSDATGHRTLQDVRYGDYGVIVELDGRETHDTASARDADAARDLAELAVTGDVTLRLTYGQVYRDRCRTAALVARVLQSRGWQGTPRPCPQCRH
jgi:very-short-patch-repair endonuclease